MKWLQFFRIGLAWMVSTAPALGQTTEEVSSERLDSLARHLPKAPILGPLGDTLLVIYRGSGDLSLAERAEFFSQQIAELAQHPGLNEDSLRIRKGDSGTELWFRNSLILNVSPEDERLYDASGAALARIFRDRSLKSIRLYQDRTRPERIVKEIASTLLVLLVLMGSIWMVNRVVGWWERRYLNRVKRRMDLNDTSVDLLFSDNARPWILWVFRLSRWALSLTLIAFSVPLIFSIFPETRPITQQFITSVSGPLLDMVEQFKNYLPNLVTIGVLILFFRLIIRGLGLIKTEIENGKMHIRGFYPDWSAPTYQLIRVLLLALLFVLIFPYLPGSKSPVFQGVSVFLGFLFTFSSAGSLSNIISGMMLTYMRLFRIGDRVRLGEVYGDVVERNLLVTRIKTPFNEIISVPNSSIMGANSINYSTLAQEEGLILSTTVTIGYDLPFPLLYQALIDAAKAVEGIQSEPEPFVLQTSLDDFYISYRLCFFTKEPNRQAFLLSRVHEKIQEICAQRGIEIMSPHYRSERDGSASTLPDPNSLKRP